MKKGRKNYITHRERDLKETIQEEGLLNGLKTWKDKIVESGKKKILTQVCGLILIIL